MPNHYNGRVETESLLFEDRASGCLLGLAMGDALGLPLEGISPRRIARLQGAGEPRRRLLFGRGMISDDTDHACMTA